MSDQNGSAPAGNPAGDAGTATAAPWYGAEAGDDVKGFVELKGWDTPDKAISSYRNLETLLGADKAGRAVVWPKDENDAEAWKAIHARLGVPEKPDDYKLPVPDGQSDAFAKAMAPVLHKLGVPAAAAEKLAAAFNDYGTQQQQAAQAAAEQRVAQEMDALKAEWGQAYDQNKALGSRFATAMAAEMGWDPETTAGKLEMLEAAWGSSALMKFMAAAGKFLGEDRFAEGDQPSGRILSPAAAMARITELQQDKEFFARLEKGDAAAKAEWDRLIRQSTPPESSAA